MQNFTSAEIAHARSLSQVSRAEAVTMMEGAEEPQEDKAAEEEGEGVRGQDVWMTAEQWAAKLTAAITAQPLVGTALEAVEPMAAVGIDIFKVRNYIARNRASLRDRILAQYNLGTEEFDDEKALIIRLFTVSEPFAIYPILEAEMHSAGDYKEAGADGISDRLRACLPFIKFLWIAIASLPMHLVFTGKVHHCATWSTPIPDNQHADEYFAVGREFFWHEFKVCSIKPSLMSSATFTISRADRQKQRTIFQIEGVPCCRIQGFCATRERQAEDEVVFLPMMRFLVKGVMELGSDLTRMRDRLKQEGELGYVPRTSAVVSGATIVVATAAPEPQPPPPQEEQQAYD